jgi:hypothetical protein
MRKPMKSYFYLLRKEEGSVLVVGLLILLVLTVIGMAASTTSTIEIQIAGNEKFHKIAFYAAEAARGYVARSPDLYGPDNITTGEALSFPSNTDPDEKFSLSSTQSFYGDVEYVDFSAPPRGSGYEAGKFRAHRYKMTCYGFGPSNAVSEIQAGFYRIGF